MHEPTQHQPARRVAKRRDAALLSSASARASILLAALLLLPVALIPIQDIPALEHFHNRKLQSWPDATVFAKGPPNYFSAARRWIADRVFPIMELSTISRRVMLRQFDSAPQNRITMGADGYVFLNGSSDADVFGIFRNVCERAHTASAAKELRTAIDGLTRYSREHGVAIDVVAIPTMASIYGGLLPRSVPIELRNACGARARGESPLLALDDDPALHFKYPLREMNRSRNDEAFFPKANWHARGLSLKVARDAYLVKLGLPAVADDELIRTMAPSELFASYGIDRQYPVYEVTNSRVVEAPHINERLRADIADLFDVPRVVTHAYENRGAAANETVLMLSDSYGDYSAGVFASEFSKLLHVTTNDMKEERLPTLLERVERIMHVDRVIMLVMEGNYDRVVRWAGTLRSSVDASEFDAVTETNAPLNFREPIPCEGSIDSFNGISPTPLTLTTGNVIELSGWNAISTRTPKLPEQVLVAIENETHQVTLVQTHANPRPDLATYFSSELLAQSGFASKFSIPFHSGALSLAIARLNDGVLSLGAPIRTWSIQPTGTIVRR